VKARVRTGVRRERRGRETRAEEQKCRAKARMKVLDASQRIA
jgi:hypothetical protein